MSAEDWLDLLAAAEEHVVPADLRAASDFLLRARNSKEGWGNYVNVPSDLGVTAQVITAFQLLKHPKAEELATSTASWAQWRRHKCPPETAHDFISLLALATADRDMDGSYTTALRSGLDAALVRIGHDTVATATLALAVLASEPWPAGNKERAQLWVDELVRRGHGSDAWYKAGQPAEWVPTAALAMRALAPWRDRPDVAEVVQRGLECLQSYVRGTGWDAGAASGTYALSLVLRALSTEPDYPTDLCVEGLGLLRSRQHSDGGWGGGDQDDGSSSVEHTSAAIIALTECGVSRYVPLLVTRTVLRNLTSSLDEATRRQSDLEENIENQVEERLGRAIRERHQLRHKLEERDAELARLRRAPLALDLVTGTDSSRTRSFLVQMSRVLTTPRIKVVEAFLGVLATLGIIISSTNLVENWATSSLLAVTGGVLAAGLGFILSSMLRARARPARPVESLTSRRLRQLVREFIGITAELPNSVLEELVYRLAREGADLPGDHLVRFFAELTMRQLRVDSVVAEQLLRWVEAFAAVELEDRPALISQLRRAIL